MNPEEIADRLARIETKLDEALTKVADHAYRLDGVETWKIQACAIISLFAMIWGPVCAVAVQWLSRRF